MTTKTKSTKTAEAAVLDAAGDVVNLTIVKPSDVAGTPAAEAARLDREIRDGFRVVLHSHDALLNLIEEAKGQQIHKMLSDPATGKAYKSWTAYLTDVLGSLNVDVKTLSTQSRRHLFVLIYNAGMPQKAIAEALKVSAGAVNKAIQQGRESGDVDADRETVGRDGKVTKKTNQSKGGDDDSKVIADAKRLLTTAKRIAAAEIEEADRELLSDLLTQVQAELTKAKKATKA
ncbi:sigma factor-like helix-turn-helix DNA-binding protein [Nocardioides sp.]|uniref:sigma-70 region 4 domain-containing protein n=1 Tax=Nocardioides sp. TaxID=35761 RepID=UPI002CC5EF00|nr:sigma factor-like helix-turn-helix DNA-binding protein [Nocardioides sp.]HSX68444.1 sigma factor-like helix-turn-helix DNA-binding protein [Nocardioides sp.]